MSLLTATTSAEAWIGVTSLCATWTWRNGRERELVQDERHRDYLLNAPGPLQRWRRAPLLTSRP